MRFIFGEKDVTVVRDKIMAAIGNRELGKIVNFDVSGGGLDVVISKLGTSKLSFDKVERPDGLEFKLASEKIAFAHRAFKEDVKNKILSVVKQIGGKVLED